MGCPKPWRASRPGVTTGYTGCSRFLSRIRAPQPMTDPKSPCTLLEVLNAAPGDRTAIIVPEADIRVSYAALRAQVMTMADALASAVIKRGDRVAMALPNGLPAI